MNLLTQKHDKQIKRSYKLSSALSIKSKGHLKLFDGCIEAFKKGCEQENVDLLIKPSEASRIKSKSAANPLLGSGLFVTSLMLL